VIWAKPKELTIVASRPIATAKLLSYPDGKERDLPVDGVRVKLASPEIFQLLTITLEQGE